MPEPSLAAARPADETDETAYRAFVERHLRRNWAAHLFHGLLGQTGFRLVNAPTFVPAYLYLLSGSEILVGVGRGVQALGQCLTPLVSANLIAHRRHVLRIGITLGALMRLQVLGIALAGFLLAPEPALLATLLFLALFGAFMGMQGVVFPFLMSKVIPVERRGLLTGARNALAGLTAAGAAVLGGLLIDGDALGNGYAATFLLAFVLTALGLCAMLFTREPASPETAPRTPLGARLAALPVLLRGDRGFTVYFVARALATLGRMALPYYVLYAGTQMEVGGVELGILTTLFVVSETTTNLAWGVIGDRFGFRLVFLGSVSIWIAAVLGLIAADDIGGVRLAFVAIGTGLGGFMMSSRNLILEFGARSDLPMRLAVANTLSEAMGAVGPIAGGVVAATFSYAAVFWTAVVFKAIALLAVLTLVREPRHDSPEPPLLD